MTDDAPKPKVRGPRSGLPLGFKIVDRGIPVLVEASINHNGEHGCRPASEVEVILWLRIFGQLAEDT